MKNKLFIYAFVFLFVPFLSLAQTTVIDTYDVSNADSNRATGPDDHERWGQCFTSDTSQVLDSAIFYLKDRGEGTANINAEVYAVSGSYGTSCVATGAVLATSDTIDYNTLTGSYLPYTFEFSGGNRITLSASTNYIVVIHYEGTPSSIYALDQQTDVSSPTHDGNIAGQNSGTYTAYSGEDSIFTVYAEDETPGGGISTATSVHIEILENSMFVLLFGIVLSFIIGLLVYVLNLMHKRSY